MEKQNASLDSSFWINAYAGGLTPFLTDYFCLFATRLVQTEITYPLDVLEIPSPGARLFRQWCERGLITRQDPVMSVDWFQPGENQAIALALEYGYWLLIDDNNPYHFAKSRGLPVLGSMDLAVALYDQGRLSYPQALASLQSLGASKHLVRQAMSFLAALAQLKGDRP